MDPPSPPSQRNRTALRTNGGRFFYEGKGVKSRDGSVEGAADVGSDELEGDRAEQVAKRLRRPGGPLLEHLLDVVQPVLDPLDGRRAEDLVSATAQGIDLFGQYVDSSFGFHQGFRKRMAAPAFGDEIDEVREPALLSGELGLLQLQRVRKVGAELGDLFFDSLEPTGDVLGISYLLWRSGWSAGINRHGDRR